MIIKFKKNATDSEKHQLFQYLEELGIEIQPNGGSNSNQICIVTNSDQIDCQKIESYSSVERIFKTAETYSLAHRNSKQENTVIKLPSVTIGEGIPVVIAGPCAVENESQILEIARLVSSFGVKIMRGGAFKPRTSPYSFSGLEDQGLKLLDKARRETGVLIVTEVLDTGDVELVAEYSDILQIGSRNMQNYKLLKAVGHLNKPVLLKRGMSATLEEFLGSAEHILSEGNEQIILCERGIRTFVEYSRNTLDLNIVPVIKKNIQRCWVCLNNREKTNTKTATPKIDNFKSQICVFALNGFLRNGKITSCIKMVPHECRYVLWVVIKAANTTAQNNPIMPTGIILLSATGVVI